MREILPNFPVMPERQLQYRDADGEWKNCSSDWRALEGMEAHEYRELALTNEQMRKYAHDVIDYFADVAEVGEVCGAIEKRCLVIFVKDNRIMFGIGEK